MNRRERKHCPHIDVVGVWGDAINHAPGYRRNFCRDCGRYLDPGYITPTCTDCAGRPYGGQA